jgi:hypothetical protein
MVGLKDGPRLVIDHMIMYQLLNSEAFWDMVPMTVAAELREEGTEVGRKALDIAMGRKCAGCTSIRSVVAPLHNRLWRMIAAVQPVPGSCDPLAGFIALKRGYRPRPIVVYYVGDDGGTAELNL